MAATAPSKRSLFSSSQAAHLRQKIDTDYERSVSLFLQGKYQESLTAAVDFIDASHSLPGEDDLLNVMAAKLLVARCKIYQYDFAASYTLLTESMNTAMTRFGEKSLAVVEALLAQAEYCFLQAVYPETDTILIKALTILGKLRDAGLRSNLFKSICGEVVYALCELYLTTGLYERVFVLVKEFEQVIDAAIGPDHPNHYYQLMVKGKVLKLQGKFELARQAFESVISLLNQTGFKEHKFIILALIEIAEINYLTSNFAESLRIVEEATVMTFGFYAVPDHIAFSPLKSIKGHILLYQGSYLESLDLLREAMQGCRQRLGDKHPFVADALCNISVVLNHMGKVTAAAKVVKQASLIYEAIAKRNEIIKKSRGYATLQLCIGANLIEAGKYKEALTAYNSSFVVFTALAKALRVEAEYGVATAILGLAEAMRLLSQFKKAKGLIGKAGVMLVKLFGEQNVRVSDCLLQLACLNSDMGYYEEANSLFAKSHSIKKKELALNHPSTVELFRVYALNFARVGYFEDGLEPLRVAHALSVKMFNKRSLAVAKALYLRAKVISDLGHANDADVMFQASLVMLQEVLGDTENGLYVEVLIKTAEGLRLQGRIVESESALRQALLIAKTLYDQQKHISVAEALTSLACILLEGKKPLEAKALLEENILPIYDELCGKEHISYVFCGGLIGLCENAIKPTANLGRSAVQDAIVKLVKQGRVGKEHIYLKMLRTGDENAANEADRQLMTEFPPEGENKFSIVELTLPTEKEIKKASNVTEQILSSTFSEASDQSKASRSLKPAMTVTSNNVNNVTVNIADMPEEALPSSSSNAMSKHASNSNNNGPINPTPTSPSAMTVSSLGSVDAVDRQQQVYQMRQQQQQRIQQQSYQSPPQYEPTSAAPNMQSDMQFEEQPATSPSEAKTVPAPAAAPATSTPTPNQTPALSPRFAGRDGIPSSISTNPYPAATFKESLQAPISPIFSDPQSMMSHDKPALRSARLGDQTQQPQEQSGENRTVVQSHSTTLPKLGRKANRAYNPSIAEGQQQMPQTQFYNPTQKLISSAIQAQQMQANNNNNNGSPVSTKNESSNAQYFEGIGKSSSSVSLPPINGVANGEGNTSYESTQTIESILKSVSMDSILNPQQSLYQPTVKSDLEKEFDITQALSSCPAPATKANPMVRTKMRSSNNAMNAMKAAASSTNGPSLSALQFSSTAPAALF